jgi:hypothetical protein
MGQVTCVQSHCAVSDVCGTVELYDFDDPRDWGRPALTFRGGVNKTIVGSTTRDAGFGSKQIDLLKICRPEFCRFEREYEPRFLAKEIGRGLNHPKDNR